MIHIYEDGLSYTDFVASKAKPNADIISDLSRIPQSAHLLHMAIGIDGEAFEIEEWMREGKGQENLIEELGDLAFFLEGYISMYPGELVTELAPLEYTGIDDLVWQLRKATGTLLDKTKRMAIYGKGYTEELSDDAAKCLAAIRTASAEIASVHFVPQSSIYTHNRKKLDKRYAEGYSNTAANERADKQ